MVDENFDEPEFEDGEQDFENDGDVPESDEDSEPKPENEGEDAPVESKSDRYQRLANERRQESEKREAAERERDFYRQQIELAQQSHQSPADIEELDPDEKWRRDIQSNVNQTLLTAQDLSDKADFKLKAAENPLYGKYADRVETELAKIRQQGGNASRDGVLAYLVGRDALSNGGKPTGTQRKTAQRTAAARGTPANRPAKLPAKAAPSGNSISELEERLREVEL